MHTNVKYVRFRYIDSMSGILDVCLIDAKLNPLSIDNLFNTEHTSDEKNCLVPSPNFSNWKKQKFLFI